MRGGLYTFVIVLMVGCDGSDSGSPRTDAPRPESGTPSAEVKTQTGSPESRHAPPQVGSTWLDDKSSLRAANNFGRETQKLVEERERLFSSGNANKIVISDESKRLRALAASASGQQVDWTVSVAGVDPRWLKLRNSVDGEPITPAIPTMRKFNGRVVLFRAVSDLLGGDKEQWEALTKRDFNEFVFLRPGEKSPIAPEKIFGKKGAPVPSREALSTVLKANPVYVNALPALVGAEVDREFCSSIDLVKPPQLKVRAKIDSVSWGPDNVDPQLAGDSCVALFLSDVHVKPVK